MYAAGKIPGSFFKREGRAGEKGTLTARMIDRPLRPLFPKGWRRETQLVVDPACRSTTSHPYDILAMNGASAALMVSDIPFPVPVGAVRIGAGRGGRLRRQPRRGVRCSRAAPRPDRRRHRGGDPDGRGRRQRDHRGRDPRRAGHRPRRDQAALPGPARAARSGRQGQGGDRRPAGGRVHPLRAAEPLRRRARRGHPGGGQARPPGRHQDRSRRRSLEALGRRPRDRDSEKRAGRPARVRQAREGDHPPPHRRGQEASRRPRARTRSAPIWIEVGVAPRTHGSALFTRGQTQALSVAALGTTRDEMRLDTLGLQTEKHYFHHYNFPPFSVGEAGFMRGPKRRDIGHGALAERALVPWSRRWRTSRTRFAWSRTSSSRTARRRWPRSADRRCR